MGVMNKKENLIGFVMFVSIDVSVVEIIMLEIFFFFLDVWYG